jgi:hypothetical protein
MAPLCAPTYVTQMEALKGCRTGAEQKVTVQHLSVSEGGQAIVGNVTQVPLRLRWRRLRIRRLLSAMPSKLP